MPYIDPNWKQVEGQEGLYVEEREFTIGSTTYVQQILHSADGYCFYNNTWSEEDRIYAQWSALGMGESVSNFTSVPIEDWMEIVSVVNKPVTE